MKKRNREEDRAALEVLRKTGVNVLEAALVAREALECGYGRIKRARKCIELGVRALKQREKTVTFNKAVETALEERIGHRARSLSDFRYLAQRLMRNCPGLARRRVRGMTPKECSLYIRQAYDTPRQRNKARLAMSAVFSTAIKHEWCDHNPIAKVPREKLHERRIRILTPEEIRSLLITTSGYKEGICLAAVSIMLYAGIRPHEVERLPWDQIHLDEKVIYILPQHSKTGGARRVTIHPPLEAILRKIMQLNIPRGKMVCPPGWRKHWAAIHRLAGWTGGKRWVEDVLRHTFASHHLSSFRSYAELQLEMGHRSAELLRTRYVAMEGIQQGDDFWLPPAGII